MRHLVTLVLLPFVVARLLFSLSFFAFQLLVLHLAPIGPILVFLGLVGLYGFAFSLHVFDTDLSPSPPEPSMVYAQTQQQTKLIQEKIVAEYPNTILPAEGSQLDQTKATLESLLTKNQTHRDLLLNAAILYAELDNEAAATALLEKAQYSDPNYPLFKE